MKIAVDMRYLGFSGIGKYLEGIFEYLSKTNHELILLGKKELLKKYEREVIEDNNSPFSIKGLKVNSKINHCDCFFTPNFMIPFGIKIPIFSMIHDLIFRDENYSSKNILDKKIKMFFLKMAVNKSKAIFTVSNFSKKRIEKYYPKADVIVAYPSITKGIRDYNKKNEKKEYIIFVGNIKKNKGLDTLLKAYRIVREKTDLSLYIVGNANKFRTSDDINKYLDIEGVNFTGYVDDQKLYELISSAKFLIQPSRYEGFGTPPLEALYLNTQPIISDIEVFKEIYGDLPVLFFNSDDENDLANKILNAADDVKDCRNLILGKYSYKNSCEIIVNKIMEELK